MTRGGSVGGATTSAVIVSGTVVIAVVVATITVGVMIGAARVRVSASGRIVMISLAVGS